MALTFVSCRWHLCVMDIHLRWFGICRRWKSLPGHTRAVFSYKHECNLLGRNFIWLEAYLSEVKMRRVYHFVSSEFGLENV